MQSASDSPTAHAAFSRLQLLLGAALAQGAALCILQLAGLGDISGGLGLYCVAVFLPVSLQLLAAHVGRPLLWIMLLLLGGALFGFGWHEGTMGPEDSLSDERLCFLGVVCLWWLLVLPFLESRLEAGRWVPDYGLLWQRAWRNVILLLGAGLLTGLCGLVLVASLALPGQPGFSLLPWLLDHQIGFVYAVGALCFGGALHLLNPLPAQLCAVYGRLRLPLMGLACGVFALVAALTLELVVHVPRLSGDETVGATGLLLFMAVAGVLLNVVHGDGTREAPHPRWLALALRIGVVLMLPLALAALYGLLVRIHHEGLTVVRGWGLVVSGATLACWGGYALACARRGPWMERVNILVALALILVLGACLTPLLSPYRLAADSQYRRILEGQYTEPLAEGSYVSSHNNRFVYLHFSAGAYGRARLQALTELRSHPRARQISQWATSVRTGAWRQHATPLVNAATLLSALTLYPTGKTLGKDLEATFVADWQRSRGPFVGIFADLDRDGVEEFVLMEGGSGWLYRMRNGRWQRFAPVWGDGSLEELKELLAQGQWQVAPGQWIW